MTWRPRLVCCLRGAASCFSKHPSILACAPQCIHPIVRLYLQYWSHRASTGTSSSIGFHLQAAALSIFFPPPPSSIIPNLSIHLSYLYLLPSLSFPSTDSSLLPNSSSFSSLSTFTLYLSLHRPQIQLTWYPTTFAREGLSHHRTSCCYHWTTTNDICSSKQIRPRDAFVDRCCRITNQFNN